MSKQTCTEQGDARTLYSAPGLAGFARGVEARALALLQDAQLNERQHALLARELVQDAEKKRSVLSHRLAPFYLAVRALGAQIDGNAERIAAAFLLLQRFASLVDKIEDEDLEGDLRAVGSAAVLNSSLVLFVLGLDQLLDPGPGALGAQLRGAVTAHLLRMARGQDAELATRFRLRSKQEVIACARDKAAEFALLFECAARCAVAQGSCAPQVSEAFVKVGEDIALLVQIANDLSDLFGKKTSDDLRTGTWNIPLTFFVHSLDETARGSWLNKLVTQPESQRSELQVALYKSGALVEVAKLAETARKRIHAGCLAIGVSRAYSAFLLAWLDDLAALFYRPEALASSPSLADIEVAEIDSADREPFELMRSAQRAVREAFTLPEKQHAPLGA